jgi:hypothetical protein
LAALGDMKISTHYGDVTVVDEPTYTFGSADNVRSYAHAKNLYDGSRPVSVHGILLGEAPLLVVGGSGGATGVHSHSSLWLNDRLYMAVCDSVVCISIQPLEIVWSRRVDDATCFGVHFHPETGSLISHGELEVARFNEDGAIQWRSGGHDIFTGRFSLGATFIEAEDYCGNLHRFLYTNGKDPACADVA